MKKYLFLFILAIWVVPTVAQISSTSGRNEGYYGTRYKFMPQRSNISTTFGRYEGYSTGGRKYQRYYQKTEQQSLGFGGESTGKSDVYLPGSQIYFKGGPSYGYNEMGYNLSLGYYNFFGKSPFYYGMEAGLKTRDGSFHGRYSSYNIFDAKCNGVYYSPINLGGKFLRKVTHDNFAVDFSVAWYFSYDFAINLKDKDGNVEIDYIKDDIHRIDFGPMPSLGFWFGKFYLGYSAALGINNFGSNRGGLRSDQWENRSVVQMWRIGFGF